MRDHTKNKTIKKFLFISTIFALICTWFISPAQAQSTNELTLRLSRDFGYSSGTGKIQGTFSLRASGPDNLERVEFYIDGELMGIDEEPPFKLQFNTGSYPLGVHTLSAIGYTAAGDVLQSNEHRREFVDPAEGWQTVGKIVIPIFGIALAAILFSFLLPTLFGRKRASNIPLGAQRNYGLLGGTICPKCQRPFPLHIYGMNLGIGKYDRCPHCGKWSLVRRQRLSELRAAEASELASAESDQPQPPLSEEERLRKELDDSRYLDL